MTHLYPAIDIFDGAVVRLAQGDYDRQTPYRDDPVEVAREFEDSGATWVHMVDLNGARSGEPRNIEVIERVAKATNLRIEVGGGIRSLETIERLRASGVTRCVLGTKLATDPEFTQEACARFGEAIVAGVDARDGMVAINGWREGVSTKAEDLVTALQGWGVRHLVYTDIAKDGMQTGVDTHAYARIAGFAGFPVVASGGVSSLDDVAALAALGDETIEGIIVGRALYEKNFTVPEALEVIERAKTERG